MLMMSTTGVLLCVCRWKVHESCMLALGTVCSLVIETVKSGKVQFDVSAFLQNVVLTDLNLSGQSLTHDCACLT